MKWKDKEGKAVSFKEFMKRWKQGMMQASPLQIANANSYGYYFSLVGVVLGIYYSFKNSFLWLGLVLIGALILNLISWYANHQRILLLRGMEESLRKSNETSQGTTYIQ